MPGPKSYEGDELLFKVHFTEAVRAYTNRAILPVTIGNNTVDAIYASGSRTNILTFKYVVQASDLDADIMTVGSALLPNGGTLISKDGYGIQADLTLHNVGSTSGIIFGQAPPQALNVSITGTAQVGSTLNGSYIYQDADSDVEEIAHLSGTAPSMNSGRTRPPFQMQRHVPIHYKRPISESTLASK